MPRGQPWTPAEDADLKRLVEENGTPRGQCASDYWCGIAARMAALGHQRSHTASYNRWYTIRKKPNSASFKKCSIKELKAKRAAANTAGAAGSAVPVAAEDSCEKIDMAVTDDDSGARAPAAGTAADRKAALAVDEQDLAKLLGQGTVLLYGDSICEEFGEKYLKDLGIRYEYADHNLMRGSVPQDINKQVSTQAHTPTLKPNVEEKIERASLIVLSAGKNIMWKDNNEGIAFEVRNFTLMPMLSAKPNDLPMLYLTPTKKQHVGTADEVAKHLSDMQSRSFKIITRKSLDLTAEDFLDDKLHLKRSGNEKLLQNIVQNLRKMLPRTPLPRTPSPHDDSPETGGKSSADALGQARRQPSAPPVAESPAEASPGPVVPAPAVPAPAAPAPAALASAAPAPAAPAPALAPALAVPAAASQEDQIRAAMDAAARAATALESKDQELAMRQGAFEEATKETDTVGTRVLEKKARLAVLQENVRKVQDDLMKEEQNFETATTTKATTKRALDNSEKERKEHKQRKVSADNEVVQRKTEKLTTLKEAAAMKRAEMAMKQAEMEAEMEAEMAMKRAEIEAAEEAARKYEAELAE